MKRSRELEMRRLTAALRTASRLRKSRAATSRATARAIRGNLPEGSNVTSRATNGRGLVKRESRRVYTRGGGGREEEGKEVKKKRDDNTEGTELREEKIGKKQEKPKRKAAGLADSPCATRGRGGKKKGGAQGAPPGDEGSD